MPVTDLNQENGWIPEPTSNQVLTENYTASAVEQVARKVTMTSETMSVPRFAADDIDIVAEHAVIPLVDATLDEVVLRAHKWANRYAISIEDQRDAVVDVLNQFKLAWLNNYAVSLDNACLGAAGGPFESVHALVGAEVAETAGALDYEDLVAAFGDLEDSNYGGNLVVIAHPSFAMALRNLKDAAGDRVVSDPLGAGVPTIFGNPVYFSKGARTSAVPTKAPEGNPLMVIGNRQHLILGVRSGPESMVSTEARWETDEVELKMRARRGFVAATADAFKVIERTDA